MQFAPTPTRSGSHHMTIMTFCICLGAFVFAYNTVCLTQIATLLQLKNDLSKDELVYSLSIATSAFNFGAFISPILYKKYVGIFGQLRGLLWLDIVGILAIITELTYLQLWVLASARLVLGFVIGISTAIIPVYINSLAPASLVGRLGSFNQLLQTLGVFTAYLCGYFIHEKDKSDEIRWRLLLGFFPIIFLGLRIITLQFIYPFETLQRHITKDQIGKLNQYSKLVYGSESSETISWITTTKSFKKFSKENSQTWLRRFIIALVVIASNQLSGVNAILYYAKQLFGKITNGDAANTQNIIVLLSLLQILGTLISTQIIDKIGRKTLILWGQSSLIALLGLIFFSNNILSLIASSNVSTIITIFLIFFHIFIMNATLGPCCIVYCTQIISDVSWIIVTLKGCSLLIALTTQYIIQYIGLGFMFLGFGVLSLLAHLVLRRGMIETKGVSTRQVYSLFGKESDRRIIDQNGIEDENFVDQETKTQRQKQAE